MVSEASKKKAAQKKAAAAAAAKRGGKVAATSKVANKVADKVADRIADIQISDRTCTSVLCSHPLSRDIRLFEHLYERSPFRLCPSPLQVSSISNPNASKNNRKHFNQEQMGHVLEHYRKLFSNLSEPTAKMVPDSSWIT